MFPRGKWDRREIVISCDLQRNYPGYLSRASVKGVPRTCQGGLVLTIEL